VSSFLLSALLPSHLCERRLSTKIRRPVFITIVALLLCGSLAFNASAASKSAHAGIYGILKGTATPVTRSTLLPTTTTITQNPDNAYLVVLAEVTNGVRVLDNLEYHSARGVTSFNVSIPVYAYNDYDTIYVHMGHGVQGGTQAPGGYSCHYSMQLK
jgi:hypothetical protein